MAARDTAGRTRKPAAPTAAAGHRNQSYALRHALAILDTLAERQHARGVSLNQLVASTGLNKSTVLRLIAPLTERGIVAKNPETGTYRLGLRVVEWAATLLSETETTRVAAPHLDRLVEATGETAFLVVYDDGDVVYLSKVESPNLLRMSSNIGTRTPAYSTANGKAILAFLPPSEVDRVVARGLRPFTPYTLTSPDALRAQLEDVRVKGYAVDNQENVLDARCAGAPLFDRQGQVAGAISLSGPAFRVDLARVEEMGGLVVAAAAAISRELGYVPSAR